MCVTPDATDKATADHPSGAAASWSDIHIPLAHISKSTVAAVIAHAMTQLKLMSLSINSHSPFPPLRTPGPPASRRGSFPCRER